MFDLIAWIGKLAIGTKILLGIVLIGGGIVLAAGCVVLLREQPRYARPNFRKGDLPPDEKVPIWLVG